MWSTVTLGGEFHPFIRLQLFFFFSFLWLAILLHGEHCFFISTKTHPPPSPPPPSPSSLHGSLWIIRSKHTILLYGTPGETESACALSQKNKTKKKNPISSCARSIINTQRTVVPSVLETYGGNSVLINNIIICHLRRQTTKGAPDENITNKTEASGCGNRRVYWFLQRSEIMQRFHAFSLCF